MHLFCLIKESKVIDNAILEKHLCSSVCLTADCTLTISFWPPSLFISVTKLNKHTRKKENQISKVAATISAPGMLYNSLVTSCLGILLNSSGRSEILSVLLEEKMCWLPCSNSSCLHYIEVMLCPTHN